jgi:LacI family transcriptional regulator
MMVELVDTHSDHVERELGAALSALQPDGVILTPPHSENHLITALLAARRIPFARIGSNARGPGIALTMGDEGAAHLAASRLIKLGHRRIGMIAGPSQYSLSGWRIDGWQRALTEAGLAHEGLLETGDFGYASGVRAAAALLERNPDCTAIIASNDQMALATLEVARDRGLVVPDDLSVISFDNTPIVRFSQPPLTAIDQPIAETVSRAVKHLIGRGPEADDDAVIEVAAGLVERASTAPPPAPEPDPATARV